MRFGSMCEPITNALRKVCLYLAWIIFILMTRHLGCNAIISLTVLKEDKALQKKAKAAKRRAEQERESDSDEEIDD
jgi:hypothetical protein